MYRKYFKRLLDFLGSLLLLIILWPLILIVALMVRIKLGSPVLFKQLRPGKDAKIFKLYKFRTMTNAKDENGELLPDGVRLTAFGKWLRANSLDELPQFFNILKGDMSFVGPRPLLVEYLSRYTKKQSRRHEVTPGLTGLAQINGRNTIKWGDKFKYDVKYVDNFSFKNDFKIMYETFKIVLKKVGISEAGNATVTRFDQITKKSKSGGQ